MTANAKALRVVLDLALQKPMLQQEEVEIQTFRQSSLWSNNN